MLKQIGNKIEIKPWTIYLWRNGDKMEGASPVVTKDGIRQIYCHGWAIEPDPEARRNEDKHKEWRAKIKVKNLLNNTLNVLNWYGKSVVDSDGNIDPMKLAYLEAEQAKRLAIQNLKMAEAKKGTKYEEYDLNDVLPIRKFPQKDITLEEAKKYGFKGDLANPRTSGLTHV